MHQEGKGLTMPETRRQVHRSRHFPRIASFDSRLRVYLPLQATSGVEYLQSGMAVEDFVGGTWNWGVGCSFGRGADRVLQGRFSNISSYLFLRWSDLDHFNWTNNEVIGLYILISSSSPHHKTCVFGIIILVSSRLSHSKSTLTCIAVSGIDPDHFKLIFTPA